MLTRCNQCEKLFVDDNGLIKVIETSFATGKIDYKKYDNQDLIETDECWEEVVIACPTCMTDDFLMDLGYITLKEVSEELNYREQAGSDNKWNDSLSYISTDELETMEIMLEKQKVHRK